VCPNHLTSPLFLQNTSELYCSECSHTVTEKRVRSGIGKVLETSPVKVDFIDNFTSKLQNNYEKNNSKNWTNWRKENLSFLLSRNINKDSLGLDIGAGNSPFNYYFDSLKLISIDFTRYPGINIICDLNNNIPISSESIDYIIMTNVLEHLYDLRVINEAHRLLKKGGNLYITVPFLLDVHQAPYDYHRYTYLYLEKKLKEEGFEIDYIKSSGDFGTFQTLVEHYYRYPIHQGNLVAKLLWQFQKTINYLLKKFVPSNFRNDFTGGYMISAKKSI